MLEMKERERETRETRERHARKTPCLQLTCMLQLISDCSERLTDEQVEEVLQLVSLGSGEPGGEAADAMDEERSGE